MKRAFVLAVAACHRDPVVADCGRFEAHATTVIDRTTHFVWQRTPPAEPMDWAAADAYCKSIGMRLPASLALSEIMPLDACAFAPEDGGDATVWSATEQRIPVIGPYIGANSDKMVVVYAHEGFAGEDRAAKHRVRCWKNR